MARNGNGNSGKLQGTIFKKCDRAAHRPESNRGCADGSCQHTCETPAVERCPHAWTLRYSVAGKQIEESFRDDMDRNKRVRYGTGLKKVQDAQLELTRGKRSQGQTYIAPKGGSANFGDAVEQLITHMAIGDDTRDSYRSNYRSNIKAKFGARTIAQVAIAHDDVADLLTVTMKERSIGSRRVTRMLITGTLDRAVKTGKIASRLITDIDLYDNGTAKNRKDFMFPEFGQVSKVADGTPDASGRVLKGAGICVWLMRGCGLRIRESLAVEKEDFRVTKDKRVILRVSGQTSRDGKAKVPLKKRLEGEYRDVAVPAWLWEKVKDMPAGPLMPGNGRRYEVYATVNRRFMTAAKAAGIPSGFTPHSLRHAFASVLLGHNTPIGDVSEWLGHRDVNTTYSTYRHMLPDAPVAAATVLDAEYAEWSLAA